MKQKYDITGMSCSACSARVEKVVSKVPGIDKVEVNLLQNSMMVEFAEGAVEAQTIIDAVVSAGYGASLRAGAKAPGAKSRQGDNDVQKKAAAEARQMKHRLGWSIGLLVVLMYVSMGHMFGWPLPGILLGHENVMVFVLVQLFLTLPIMYLNRKYYENGFRALFHGAPNMDTLVAMGSAAGFVYSVAQLFVMGYAMGHGDMQQAHECAMNLYFEASGMILTLVTIGKYMESRSKSRTSDAITKLVNLAPKTALVLRDGQELEIPVEEVQVGETVIIKPGQGIPVDGVLIEGTGTVDESAITGESIPVEKMKGDRLTGATVNRAGYFKMRADRVGEDTTLSQIIRLVEEAGGSKAPIAKLADKVSGVFVPVVMTIAAVTVLAWLLLGHTFSFALASGIAVLVISCPCALGLATPTAIMVGTGRGAEQGILVKSGESLETAHLIDTVVLDKTGTVTEGWPVLTDCVSVNGSEEELLLLAASLEQASEHPLAEAIVAEAKKRGLSLEPAADFLATPGQGVQGAIKGKTVLAGNLRMMKERQIDTAGLESRAEALAEEGKTVLYIAADEKLLGMVAVADPVKPTSAQAIQELTKMGLTVVMLTGDNERTAKAIQRKLGISRVVAEVLPQDKEQEIRRLQAEGRKVAMVGDGINDAPALARADVGIAIGAGTDVAIESADVVLMRSDLLDAVTAIQLSRAVIRNIKQNLFWAFFYNACGIPLAAGVFYPFLGWQLSPMFGSAAMSFSSVFVVTNALRLKGFRPSFVKQTLAGEEKASPDEVIEERKQSTKKEDMKMKKTMKIDGMMCGHCTGRVDKALNALEGVKATVSLEDKAAYLELDGEVSEELLKKAVEDEGYTVVGIE